MSNNFDNPAYVYFADVNGQRIEVTPQNLDTIKALGVTVFEMIVPPKGYTSPVGIAVKNEDLDKKVGSSNCISDGTCPDTCVHAFMGNIRINVTPKNYQKLSAANIVYTLADKADDGYIHPVEMAISPEDVPRHLSIQNSVPTVPPVPEMHVRIVQQQVSDQPASVQQSSCVQTANDVQQPITVQHPSCVQPVTAEQQTTVAQTNTSAQTGLSASIVPAKETTKVCNKKTDEEPNSFILAQNLVRKYLFIKVNNAIYIWNGFYYKFLNDADQKNIVVKEYENELKKLGYPSLMKAIVTFLPAVIPERTLVDDTSNLVVFNNGVLDMNSMEFITDPQYPTRFFIRYSVDAFFDPNATCPIFDNYLFTLAGGNTLLIDRMWEVLGMMLSSDIKAKKIVALIGVGGSGKSTFANIIKMLIRDQNVTAYTPKNLLYRFAGAKLINSAVNCCMDMPCLPLDPDIVALMKNFSGGDLVEGDVKYLPGFSYVFPGHLLFCSNYPIKLTYEDDAFAERLLLIPCDYKIPPEARNYNLLDQLKNEASAIATKAVLMYRNVRNRHYRFSGDDVWTVTAKSLCQASSFGGDIVNEFIYEKCIITNLQSDYTPAATLFERFSQFCLEKKYTLTYNSNSFSKELGRLIPSSESKKMRKGNTTFNVRTCILLKDNADPGAVNVNS